MELPFSKTHARGSSTRKITDVEQCARERERAEATTASFTPAQLSKRLASVGEGEDATGARYRVLEAILLDVERIVPHERSLEGMHDILRLCAHTAESEFTRSCRQPVSQEAMDEERALFCAFLGTLDDHDLFRVPPLPHRHVLGRDAAQQARQALERLWGVGKGAYPLGPTGRDDLEAFRADKFAGAGAAGLVQATLHSRGVTRLFQLNEWGEALELEVASLDVRYDGAEQLRFTAAQDAILHASHESTVTVGGWLLPALQAAGPRGSRRAFPTWQRIARSARVGQGWQARARKDKDVGARASSSRGLDRASHTAPGADLGSAERRALATVCVPCGMVRQPAKAAGPEVALD